MRKKIVIGNWKMNPPTLEEAEDLFRAVKRTAGKVGKVVVVVAPPAPYLGALRRLQSGGRVHLGAQNVFPEAKGSFTGEVSPPILKSMGVEYVIVGHSERRALGETSAEISKKVDALMRRGLKAVLCVGEAARDSHGEYLGELRGQILESLAGVSGKNIQHLVVAYEPVFAIGSGNELEAKDIHEAVLFVRKILSERYDKGTALSIPVLYGGSVDKKNAGAILSEGGVNGLLVGGGSLTPHEFAMILTVAHKGRSYDAS